MKNIIPLSEDTIEIDNTNSNNLILIYDMVNTSPKLVGMILLFEGLWICKTQKSELTGKHSTRRDAILSLKDTSYIAALAIYN